MSAPAVPEGEHSTFFPRTPRPGDSVEALAEYGVNGIRGGALSQARGPISPSTSSREIDEAAREAHRDIENPNRFERIVRLSQSRQYGIARSVLWSRQDAQDATQEAFLKAWLAFPSFDPQRSFVPWMGTITHRYARTLLIKIVRRRKHEYLTDTLPIVTGIESDAQYRRVEDEDLLERVFAPLSFSQAECLALFYLADMDYETIAKRLNENVATIRTRVRRARTKLRRLGFTAITGLEDFGES